MSEMPTKTEAAVLTVDFEKLRGLLQTTSAQLRSGDDAKGIESLLSAMAELEKLVEEDQNSRMPRIGLGRLLPALRTLYDLIRNQDMAGIADLLEDVFCPMTGEWMKGSDGL